jgi:hypothetical protein
LERSYALLFKERIGKLQWEKWQGIMFIVVDLVCFNKYIYRKNPFLYNLLFNYI